MFFITYLLLGLGKVRFHAFGFVFQQFNLIPMLTAACRALLRMHDGRLARVLESVSTRVDAESFGSS